MRGPSIWSVGERELMAAMVAKWNSCAFCVGAHGAIASKEIQRPAVDAALADFCAAPIKGDANVSGDHDAATYGVDR
jgi:AhpD family alkylhydroperoxidase